MTVELVQDGDRIMIANKTQKDMNFILSAQEEEMAIAFAALSKRHSVRYTIIGAAMLLSAGVAWSRVMLGVHFPSDVVAGWMGGAGWAFLAAAVLYTPAKTAADTTDPG